MFEIEELLNLFPNTEVKELLLQSYYLLQEKDKNLSSAVFEKLLLLKTMHPEINIQEIFGNRDFKPDNLNDKNLEILEDDGLEKQQKIELDTISRVEGLIDSLFSGFS